MSVDVPSGSWCLSVCAGYMMRSVFFTSFFGDTLDFDIRGTSWIC